MYCDSPRNHLQGASRYLTWQSPSCSSPDLNRSCGPLLHDFSEQIRWDYSGIKNLNAVSIDILVQFAFKTNLLTFLCIIELLDRKYLQHIIVFFAFLLDEHAAALGLGSLTAAYRTQVRLLLSVSVIDPCFYCPFLLQPPTSLSPLCVYQNVVHSCGRWLQEQQYQPWHLRSLKLQPLTPVPRYGLVSVRVYQGVFSCHIVL